MYRQVVGCWARTDHQRRIATVILTFGLEAVCRCPQEAAGLAHVTRQNMRQFLHQMRTQGVVDPVIVRRAGIACELIYAEGRGSVLVPGARWEEWREVVRKRIDRAKYGSTMAALLNPEKGAA